MQTVINSRDLISNIINGRPQDLNPKRHRNLLMASLMHRPMRAQYWPWRHEWRSGTESGSSQQAGERVRQARRHQIDIQRYETETARELGLGGPRDAIDLSFFFSVYSDTGELEGSHFFSLRHIEESGDGFPYFVDRTRFLCGIKQGDEGVVKWDFNRVTIRGSARNILWESRFCVSAIMGPHRDSATDKGEQGNLGYVWSTVRSVFTTTSFASLCFKVVQCLQQFLLCISLSVDHFPIEQICFRLVCVCVRVYVCVCMCVLFRFVNMYSLLTESIEIKTYACAHIISTQAWYCLCVFRRSVFCGCCFFLCWV